MVDFMTLTKVANVNDIKPGSTKVVVADGEMIALYNINGSFLATTNECVHKGGPLGEGYVEGEVVTCPLHGWKFNVVSGDSVNMPMVKIQTYKVVVQGEDIFIET